MEAQAHETAPREVLERRGRPAAWRPRRRRLAAWLAAAAGAARVRLGRPRRLEGGAINASHAIAARFEGGPWHGRHDLVLRAPGWPAFRASRPLAQQAQLLRAARAAGVPAPEPLFLCRDEAVAGRPFLVLRWIDGVADPAAFLGRSGLASGDDRLARALGAELARIHRLAPARPELRFLGPPPADPARAALAEVERMLAWRPEPRPVLRWALRRLGAVAPPPGPIVLAHRDFRTGNYLVQAGRPSGVLDWEFAAWSDPHEDIGWFCAKCWRRHAWHLEAGGVGGRGAFYDGYAAAGGRIEAARVRYWEAFAHLRWAAIALEQSDRGLAAGDLDLALLGRRLPELEAELLRRLG